MRRRRRRLMCAPNSGKTPAGDGGRFLYDVSALGSGSAKNQETGNDCGATVRLDFRGKSDVYLGSPSGGVTMKLALITLGLLATTGVVYAACVFC
jgi:hypothetical protein